ncbi:Hypothetical predicted protein [Mytilus galloprovincialis]|nr:Hypothetical predicted protein [Mytilus galloprovincialis]
MVMVAVFMTMLMLTVQGIGLPPRDSGRANENAQSSTNKDLIGLEFPPGFRGRVNEKAQNNANKDLNGIKLPPGRN